MGLATFKDVGMPGVAGVTLKYTVTWGIWSTAEGKRTKGQFQMGRK